MHITSNETIEGVQFKSEPEVGEVPLVCDSSSDILSRPIPVEKYGLIYAGAQKNMGPSGVTLVIMREDLLPRVREGLATMLDYRTHVKDKSLHNTPNTWGIYIINLVCKWLKDKGGLGAMQSENEAKAKLLYDAIDATEFLSRPCRSGFALNHECDFPAAVRGSGKEVCQRCYCRRYGRTERPPLSRRDSRFDL